MSQRWFFVDEERHCLGVKYNNEFGEPVYCLLDSPEMLRKYLTHPNNAQILSTFIDMKSFLK